MELIFIQSINIFVVLKYVWRWIENLKGQTNKYIKFYKYAPIKISRSVLKILNKELTIHKGNWKRTSFVVTKNKETRYRIQNCFFSLIIIIYFVAYNIYTYLKPPKCVLITITNIWSWGQQLINIQQL